jgi:hypothetical protein
LARDRRRDTLRDGVLLTDLRERTGNGQLVFAQVELGGRRHLGDLYGFNVVDHILDIEAGRGWRWSQDHDTAITVAGATTLWAAWRDETGVAEVAFTDLLTRLGEPVGTCQAYTPDTELTWHPVYDQATSGVVGMTVHGVAVAALGDTPAEALAGALDDTWTDETNGQIIGLAP